MFTLGISACCHKSANITYINNATSTVNCGIYYGNPSSSTDTLFTNTSFFSPINSGAEELTIISDRHPTFGCRETEYETLKRHLLYDTLYVIFVLEDSILKYGENQVMADWNINARYKLSVDDIDLLNYEIPYPPTPEMDFMNIVLR